MRNDISYIVAGYSNEIFEEVIQKVKHILVNKMIPGK